MNGIRTIWLPAALAAFVVVAPSSARAQEVSETDAWVREMRAMVANASAPERDLETIRAFLARPDVRHAASERGVDLVAVSDRVETLDDASAADLARGIRDGVDDEDELVGGDTFVVSSTAVIIILLVLILIAVS